MGADRSPCGDGKNRTEILAWVMAVATTVRWLLLLLLAVVSAAAVTGKHERWRMSGAVGGQVVEKERRRVVAETKAGSVTAVDVADAAGTAYRLHFITMDAGALFLPVQLHADMVFYVHSGRGKVTFIEEESSEQSSLEVERGDVYNFEQGSILYIQSYPNATRQRLRIYAIFTSEGINADDPTKPKVEAYSSVSNLVKGFQTHVLRQGFGVKPEVVEAIISAPTPPQIIPYNPEDKGDDEKPSWTEDIVDALLGVRDPEEFLNKKKKKDKGKHKSKDKDKKSKSKAFNFYSGKPDVENCYGWSRTMTNKDLDALHGSNIGMFMVNLTTGSMMGPHWNPKATEIAIVTEGSGIVQTVCPSSTPSGESRRGRHHHHGHKRRGGPPGRGDEDEGEGGSSRWQCRNSVFRVKEGDVFVVPRFHPMAQMSFNNDSFVFVGFSTHMGQNHPQFLAGKGSVLRAIGNRVLALALGQRNSTAVDKLLVAQRDSTILSCISCAEEIEEKAAKEEKKRREEEEKERREREEEEKRAREEKERKEREEEERREREKERKEREEEEKREREKEKEQEEKERKKREEEERREEEEERARKEEEKQRRREEEEKARREEEEERQREEEEREREEEERRREEEEGGGGRGDEPEREEEDEPPYRLSKKLKKHYRAGMFRSG